MSEHLALGGFMLLKKIKKLSHLVGLGAVVFGVGAFSFVDAASVGASAVSAYAGDDQRKGRGKGGDQGKRDDRGNRGDRGDRGDRGRSSQRDSDRESRRQQQQSDQNSRWQQRRSDDESRRQQMRSDQNSRGQQRRSDDESRRQQQWSDRNSRQQQMRSVGGNRQPQQQIIIQRVRSRDNDRRRDVRRRGDDRRVVNVSPRPYWGQVFGGAPVYRVDDRRFAREQQRQIKAQIKAQRQYQRDQTRYARSQYPSYSSPAYQYDDNYYANQDYNGGSSWKAQILPLLIANIFGGGGFDQSGLSNQGYYSSAQNVNQYRYRNHQVGYAPNSYEPSYGGYGYDDQYSYDQPGFDSGSILSSLPIAEIIEQYTGENEFVSGLIGSFLTQGYDQGIVAGQNARQYGYTEAQYNNPYTYENGVCDPYSASVGDNRRYLSEGYEQGYRDALAGNSNYEDGNSTGSDLVGVLLNSVLSGV